MRRCREAELAAASNAALRGLEAMLYVSSGAPKGWRRKAKPDWAYAIATSAGLHAHAAVEGMSGSRTGRLWLQSLLRVVIGKVG
jgi:hypothetical protein